MSADILQWVQVVGVTLVAALAVLAALRLNAWARGQAQETVIVKLVRAAEQMLPGASGGEKLAWVLEQVEALLPGAKIDRNLLRVLIESEVQAMNELKGEALVPGVLDLSDGTEADLVRGAGKRTFVTGATPAPD